MSDYQGKRFKASQIPDPSKPGAAHAAQQGRTSSPQQRAPRPVTPATRRRQDTPAAYRPSSYSAAKKPSRSSSHAAPSDYTEPPRKKRRSIIPILLIIIGIGLIVAAAAIFINAQIGYKQASESYQKIEKQYAPAKDASGVPVIDFDALAQTNPEVVGWIYARGTNINYPVVQCKDNNSKYLNTLFDGTSNASGAIFLDYEDTAPGMVDQQTTIYGHHMNDGSMFNVISDTTDQATFDSIEFVYYITRDATYKLRPLATKVVEDTYAKARTPNFEGDDGLKNYLSEMLDGASAVASDATDRAASATKVVTLVTCRSLSLSNTRAVMVLTPVEE